MMVDIGQKKQNVKNGTMFCSILPFSEYLKQSKIFKIGVSGIGVFWEVNQGSLDDDIFKEIISNVLPEESFLQLSMLGDLSSGGFERRIFLSYCFVAPKNQIASISNNVIDKIELFLKNRGCGPRRCNKNDFLDICDFFFAFRKKDRQAKMEDEDIFDIRSHILNPKYKISIDEESNINISEGMKTKLLESLLIKERPQWDFAYCEDFMGKSRFQSSFFLDKKIHIPLQKKQKHSLSKWKKEISEWKDCEYLGKFFCKEKLVFSSVTMCLMLDAQKSLQQKKEVAAFFENNPDFCGTKHNRKENFLISASCLPMALGGLCDIGTGSPQFVGFGFNLTTTDNVSIQPFFGNLKKQNLNTEIMNEKEVSA